MLQQAQRLKSLCLLLCHMHSFRLINSLPSSVTGLPAILSGELPSSTLAFPKQISLRFVCMIARLSCPGNHLSHVPKFQLLSHGSIRTYWVVHPPTPFAWHDNLLANIYELPGWYTD